MGLIDTLSAGFSSVNKRLWILAIPILLDLLLWVGPRITAEPLLAVSFDDVVAANATLARLANTDPGALAVTPQEVEEARRLVIDGTGAAHLEGYLAGPVIPFLAGPLERMVMSPIPSAIAAAPLPSVVKLAPPEAGFQRLEAVVSSGLVALGIWTVFSAISTGLAALYLTALGRAVSAASEAGQPPFLVALRRTWVWLVLWMALALALVAGVMVPALLLAALLGAVIPAIGWLAISIVMAIPMWARVYFYFTDAAVVVDGKNPLQAALTSLTLVRRQFWSSLGLIILVYFILFGITSAIQRLAELQPLALGAGIVVNAYVASGLLAAGMVFYRERAAAALQPAPVPQRQL